MANSLLASASRYWLRMLICQQSEAICVITCQDGTDQPFRNSGLRLCFSRVRPTRAPSSKPLGLWTILFTRHDKMVFTYIFFLSSPLSSPGQLVRPWRSKPERSRGEATVANEGRKGVLRDLILSPQEIREAAALTTTSDSYSELWNFRMTDPNHQVWTPV